MTWYEKAVFYHIYPLGLSGAPKNNEYEEPVHILLYALPGIPSVYYGSEFGIEGRKERGSDDSLRPALSLDEYKDALTQNPCTRLIAALGQARQNVRALTEGEYRELFLTTRQYVFARTLDTGSVFAAVNNDENPVELRIPAEDGRTYTGILSGQKKTAADHCLTFTIPGNSGEIWVPEGTDTGTSEPVLQETPKTPQRKPERQEAAKTAVPVPAGLPYEEMTVEQLQSAILEKMAKNGPVTEQMRRDVEENIWHDSLVAWVKSFR